MDYNVFIRLHNITCEISFDRRCQDDSIAQFPCLGAFSPGFPDAWGSPAEMSGAQFGNYTGLGSFCEEPVLPADARTKRGGDTRRRQAPAAAGRVWRVRGAPAGGVPPRLVILEGRGVPGAVTSRRDWSLPRDGRVPVPVGCPGDAGTQRRTAPVGGPSGRCGRPVCG